MTWNHRVVKKFVAGEWVYQIHEVYYENGKPTMVTENAVAPFGESYSELVLDLVQMQLAFTQPVLNYGDF